MINKITLTFALAVGMAQAAEIYVSPDGVDGNPGTEVQPLASLSAARDHARGYACKEAVTVHVADGVYYLPETLVFTPQDSGTKGMPVVYVAENEGGAVLSGGSKLNLDWVEVGGGVFQAKTPDGLEIDQLFIDGKSQRMARYPNYDPAKKAEPYQGYSADAFSKERAAKWADPEGGYIHAMHRGSWGGYHYRITGKDAEGEVTYEGGWQNNRQMGMHEDYRMVENIFEELDAEGEWYHDAETATLHYKPDAEVDLKTAKVEVVRLRHLVEFQGSEAEPVKHIRLQGFVVRHAARTFMDTKEPLLRSDWAIYRGGAFMLTGTENVSVLDTEFNQVGGNAIFVNEYNRDVLIKGCHIHDAGASGVCFVGDPDAVRDPLFEYSERNDLAEIDRTVGPKTNNYPADSTVEDCLIHGIGRVERQPAGVQISMAQNITVRDCSIYDTARAGINISEGTWGGHLIERVDVFNTVLETHDHGSFNSWGRDRYWRPDHLTASQKAVDEDPELPFLDAMKTTVIRNSRWRCEHGWDVDLDDGSSNYDLYNNLLLCGGLKLREGFRRRAWNNIIVNNGLSSHVWFQNSNDQVTGNIMARANGPYVKNDVTVEGLVDKNFYYDTPSQKLEEMQEKFGWDENSKVGDAMFVDPENGDFRVEEGSPALEIGFENFPMDQFGVKKPSLKAIAETPSFAPKHGKPAATKTNVSATPHVEVWLGATLHSLEGNEFSAYGVTKEEGGVAIQKAPEGSAAVVAGLAEGDLIQGVNGKQVADTEQLFAVLHGIDDKLLTLKVIRNQQEVELSSECPAVVEFETVNAVEEFESLPVASGRAVTANTKTSHDPLNVLSDGKLGEGYGPIFGNGVSTGAYKMDLGAVEPVAAVSSWSFKRGNRGAQKVTVYGSASAGDPGWDLSDFTPLGTIDTRSLSTSKFTAASLRAQTGNTLGEYRWILWAVSPVSKLGGGENTVFQELGVEISGRDEAAKGSVK